MIKQITDLSLRGKKVLVRVDFNVPMDKAESGKISDDTRIKASLPTIELLSSMGAKIILMSHLGRPKGKTPSCSLKPCADRLAQCLHKPVAFVSDCIGPDVEKAIASMQDGDVLLLENLRFYDAEEHPEKDEDFARELACLGDAYINDAFGTAHRAHSSTALIAKYFPGNRAAGLLMMKEVHALKDSLINPKRPFIAIIGGAKISTKLGILKSLIEKADALLLGGAMTYTFMKAMNLPVGESPYEEDMIKEAAGVMQKAEELGKKVYLPFDLLIADRFANDALTKEVLIKDGIPVGFQGMSIGPKTVEKWKDVVLGAKTIFWNGPLGVCEFPKFAKETEAVARLVSQNTQAFSVVGGGDSIAALEKAGLAEGVSHISTGGGASLEFIENGSLPGLDALEEQIK
jgi:phosphoglycerate kinase